MLQLRHCSVSMAWPTFPLPTRALRSLSPFPRFGCHSPPTDMRRDVQEIFRAISGNKQVMMFSATLSKEIRATCKKFMQNVSS